MKILVIPILTESLKTWRFNICRVALETPSYAETLLTDSSKVATINGTEKLAERSEENWKVGVALPLESTEGQRASYYF